MGNGQCLSLSGSRGAVKANGCTSELARDAFISFNQMRVTLRLFESMSLCAGKRVVQSDGA
ncbi:hypothetical protein SAMN03159495_1532 [Pseudomonas sp. NFR16]|nr:hypothetical protein SAMN03159495_1532 [Pseudomonas sp. NFR16]